MTLSVQHSDSLFGRVSGFPDGVGEVNAHASENLNSASGWHLPSQRFPLLPLLPRWPLGAGGSDMGMEPSLGVALWASVSSVIFAVTSVLVVPASELPVMAGPVGVPMTPRAWHCPLVLAGPQMPEASGHSHLIPVLCPLPPELSFKNTFILQYLHTLRKGMRIMQRTSVHPESLF